MEKYVANVKKSALGLTFELHNTNNLNRKDVLHIQSLITNSILKEINVAIKSLGLVDNNGHTVQDILDKCIANPFSSFNTE